MRALLNRIRGKLTARGPRLPTVDYSANKELVAIYNRMRTEWNLIPPDEPNYTLARKVFLDFNDFHLCNLAVHPMYLKFVPRSLLPYPKNYIKCAYYLFLDSLKQGNEPQAFEDVQRTGILLFANYPTYDKYKENLRHKSMFDDVVFKDAKPSPRELFRKLYGVYQVSEAEYLKSPMSIDATRDVLLHDFGLVPIIEDDLTF